MENLYTFEDGTFSFWTAIYGSWRNDARVVFRVMDGVDPRIRARQKEICNWDRLIPSRQNEINLWFASHPDYPLVQEN